MHPGAVAGSEQSGGGGWRSGEDVLVVPVVLALGGDVYGVGSDAAEM